MLRWQLLFGSILAAGAAFAPAIRANEKMKFRWNSVREADYYLGIVSSRGRVYYLLTHENTLYLDADVELEIRVFDALDNLVALPKIEKTQVPRHIEVPAPAPAPAPEPKLSPERLRERAEIEKLEQERAASFKQKPFRTLSMGLYLGSEVLTSEGGGSSFAGDGRVGGGAFRLDVDIHENGWIPDDLVLSCLAHSFNTIEKESSAGIESENTSEVRYRRVYFGATPHWQILQNDFGFLLGGLGLALFELPLPSIKDETTAQSEFSTHFIYGPNLEVQYAHLLSPVHTLFARFDFMPLGLGETVSAARRIFLSVGSDYAFAKVFHGLLEFFYRNESTATKVDCPTGVAGCSESGSSKSRVIGLTLGAGLTF